MRQVARGLTAIVLSLGLFALGGVGLLRATREEAPTVSSDQPASLVTHPAIDSGSLARTISSLQARLQAMPRDWRSYASLGLAYVAEARVSADPSYYGKAQGVLRRSLAFKERGNFPAMLGMGALALARHDFSAALRWGERARGINPYNGAIRGVIGDALLELGRYGDAFREIQRMVDLRPDLSSYARVSYALELRGDFSGAVRAMGLALDAAGTPEDAAWAAYQLGELYWGRGKVLRARHFYQRAVRLTPAFMPPHAGLAKVAWAKGDIEEAIRRYKEVVARYPAPEYVIALGDLYRVSGRNAEARRQYALARAEEDLFRASGVNVDLELALFEADHGRPRLALDLAREEWRRRHSIHVADAVAWALYRNGRFAEAASYSRKALRLGSSNPLLMFHAGMIELRLGHEERGRRLLRRALDINPHFSILHARAAARVLARLAERA